MDQSDKQHILKKIQLKIAQEAENLARSALHAQSYATDSECKSEGKYDTRSIEAAYLAEGQARLAAENALALDIYNNLSLITFSPKKPIALTALVELEWEDQHSYYFLGPKNGGIVIEHAGCSISLITPQSPLGQALIGKKAGDFVELRTERSIREYAIMEVW